MTGNRLEFPDGAVVGVPRNELERLAYKWLYLANAR
jgi:hypothetical protein